MIQQITGAAVVAVLLLCTATVTQADGIKTNDGRWWSGRNNLKLSFDQVSIGGRKFSAAEVAEVYATSARENSAFKRGETQGASRHWVEAAASFGEAVESLGGAAKEIALFNRLTCLVEARDVTGAYEAAQQLVTAFPRSFYFSRVQEIRARILIKRGDGKGAHKALDDVVEAPGMNVRDYYRAKLAKVYLFKLKEAGNDNARYVAARAEYARIVREIESHGAIKLARPQWLMGKVGMGRCHVYEGSFTKARPYFDAVISDEGSGGHKSLLAAAYTGRGDVRYAMVKKELASGDVGDDQLAHITKALTQAALDYVRVAKFYVEYAGDDLYSATVGAARVWATQFYLTGEKDCPLAQRASKYFYAAYQMLPRGETRRLLAAEAKRLRAKRDEACRVPDPVPAR